MRHTDGLTKYETSDVKVFVSSFTKKVTRGTHHMCLDLLALAKYETSDVKVFVSSFTNVTGGSQFSILCVGFDVRV
jgi:hypothetical protein